MEQQNYRKYLEKRERLLRIRKEIEKEQKIQNKLYVKYSPLNTAERMAEGDGLRRKEKRKKVEKVNEEWEKRHPEVSVYRLVGRRLLLLLLFLLLLLLFLIILKEVSIAPICYSR